MSKKNFFRIIIFIIVVIVSILLLLEALRNDNKIDINDLNLLFHYSNPKPVDATGAIKIEINQDENRQVDITTIKQCIDNNYLSVCDSNGIYYDLYDISGNLVLDCDSEEPIQVSEGYAIINKNGLYGAMDLNGNWIINPEYRFMESFKNNRSIISKDGTKYSVIDNTNRILTPNYEYSYLGFLNNYIVGNILAEKCHLLDYDCNLLTEIDCMDICESFSKNILIVQNDQLSYSFKSVNGEDILGGEEFRFIEPIQCNNSRYEALYMVPTKENYVGLLDQSGNYIIPANQYKYIDYISDEFITVYEEKLCGSIDIDNNPILALNHKKIIPLTDNAVGVKDKLNLVGVVDFQGKLLIDSSYSDMLGYGDGLITAIYHDEIYPNEDFMPEEENKYYYIDLAGNVRIDCSQATKVHNFENGVAIIEYNNESALIDTYGNILLGNLSN